MATSTDTHRTRGRPRTFDVDQALDRALDVFWERGYEHTSLDDLLRAMKIAKSSFYHAFESKHALYQRTIDRFLEFAPEVFGSTAASSGRDAIEAIFGGLVDAMVGTGPKRGCYLAMVSMEMSSRDPGVRRRVAEGLDRVADRFAELVRRAQSQGDVAPERDAVQLGRALTASFYGIQVLGHSNVSRAMLEDVTQAAIAQLGRPAAATGALE